jgi:branched-chain amino acid transport system permease protein
VQIILNGLVSGFAAALLALAFQSVYLPTRVFFLGLAGIYSLAPYLAYEIFLRGGGWFLAVAISILASIGLALLLEWGNHARLSRHGASEGAHLIASLGTYIILVQVVSLVWGNEGKTLGVVVGSVKRLGSLAVTGAQWTTLGVAILLLLIFGIFLMHSDLGLRLRALADNSVQFALLGYNVDHHRLLAFGLAGFFAAASALVTALDVGFDPFTGLHSVLLAVVAVMIGGQGSFRGPVLGALLLGLLRAQVVWHWSARWQEAVTFVILALILLLRPQGLLGRKPRLEATI